MAEQITRRRTQVGSRKEQPSSSSPSVLPRLISASFGSMITALAVTPLEVVKVRQQAGSAAASHALPPNVLPCPRGCGTFVLNNGLMDCVLPKSAVPYFDRTGHLSERAVQTTTTQTRASVATSSPGTFAMLRRIFLKEGISGIYAGLGATLVMSVPTTVLYFTAYDEIATRLRRHVHYDESESFASVWIPLVSGSSARLLSSFVTAPLELIRTRQASFVGESVGETAPGLMKEFRTLIRTEGVLSLYQGLTPTLWRDVPFSAIYWLCLERFKRAWKYYDTAEETPLRAACHAFFSGAAAGMIAAAVTTPFDVVKTRQQMVVDTTESIAKHHQPECGSISMCHHDGAVAYKPPPASAESPGNIRPGTSSLMKQIVETEGITGLWRGNQTRMLKVAPACAIMIGTYDFGKRMMTQS